MSVDGYQLSGVDVNGNVYVTCGTEIRKFSSEREFITEWGSWGSDDGEFGDGAGIAIDRQGNVYVTDV